MSTNPDPTLVTSNTNVSNSTPIWLWGVSVIALLWYLMDSMGFFMRVTMSDDAINALPLAQQQFQREFPLWVNLIFAIEVFGGILGSIALLLKKKWALALFVISLLGVLAQTTFLWFLSEAIRLMGAMAIVMPMVAIVIGGGLIFFARTAISKSWLR